MCASSLLVFSTQDLEYQRQFLSSHFLDVALQNRVPGKYPRPTLNGKEIPIFLIGARKDLPEASSASCALYEIMAPNRQRIGAASAPPGQEKRHARAAQGWKTHLLRHAHANGGARPLRWAGSSPDPHYTALPALRPPSRAATAAPSRRHCFSKTLLAWGIRQNLIVPSELPVARMVPSLLKARPHTASG